MKHQRSRSQLEQSTCVVLLEENIGNSCSDSVRYCVGDGLLPTMIRQNARSASTPPKIRQQQQTEPGRGGARRALLFLVLIFSVSAMSMLYMYRSFPRLTEDERRDMKIPRTMDDAKRLGRLLAVYRDQYYPHVLCAVLVTYVFLQTFAIPGSIFLSILTGFLFPFWPALLLVCLCSAVGASLCYLLSLMAGRPLLLRFFPDRVRHWAQQVSRHRDNLLNYIIFLRITPFLPNWFINIASPVLEVPLTPFFVGTFVGVAPPSFVAVQAGTTLHQLTSSSDAVSWTACCWLLAFAALSLAPVLLKRRLKQRFD